MLLNFFSWFKQKGIPKEFRIEIWDYLIGNPMRINREFFNKMMALCTESRDISSIITKDLERTFFYFFKHKDYPMILKEAKNVLTLWEVIFLILKLHQAKILKIWINYYYIEICIFIERNYQRYFFNNNKLIFWIPCLITKWQDSLVEYESKSIFKSFWVFL